MTARTARVCEHPDHEGDRVVHPFDLLEERTEWRRVSDQGREHVRVRRRVCKACAARDLADPTEQGALL